MIDDDLGPHDMQAAWTFVLGDLVGEGNRAYGNHSPVLADPTSTHAVAAELIAAILFHALAVGTPNWQPILGDAVRIFSSVCEGAGLRGDVTTADGTSVDILDEKYLHDSIARRGCRACRPDLAPYFDAPPSAVRRPDDT